MPALDALVRSRTDLTTADLESLHLLLGEWQLVADLSFADLVLWVPTRGGSGFVAVAHVRPTTAATALPGDQIGREADRDEVAEVARAAGSGGIVGQRAIAVQRAGRTIAVI
ncbi:MAG TPA: ATPase, partial [Actinobacteria bacterium]|nr:ATPase [Actinomycetota bacterium]